MRKVNLMIMIELPLLS